MVWCSTGIELVEDITNWESITSWALLKGEVPPRFTSKLQGILLRAKLNSHRFYEIYSVDAVSGIDKDDILSMFDQSPQCAAETIRKLGNKIYSDRREVSAILIT